MKTYFRYVRTKRGVNHGAIALIEDGGKVGLGISVCHPSDKFDKKVARDIAVQRAQESFGKAPYSFYELVDNVWQEELESYLPNDWVKLYSFGNTASHMIDDIVMDYARNWYKSISK